MLERNVSGAYVRDAKSEDAKEVKICEAGFHLVSLNPETLLRGMTWQAMFQTGKQHTNS